jgi:hypothetical protein
MRAVKGTYEERVKEELNIFITSLERADSLGVLHFLTKFEDVKILFNTKEINEEPCIYTITPEFLKREGLDEIAKMVSGSEFSVLHVYNAFDSSDLEIIKIYEALAQGLWKKLNKPILFSQQLVPGVSKRAITLTLGTSGLSIIKVELPTVEEWEEWLKKVYKNKVDRDVVEFVKLVSPEDLPLPFAELLKEINKRAYGIADPFKGKEFYVIEKEGVRVEASPVLGSSIESLPSPDAWTRVALLPWSSYGLTRELASAILGSSELVEGVELYKKKARGAFRIIKELEEAFNLAKKHGLKVIVCVEKVSEIKKLAEKHSIVPEFFAIEPKELIGSGVAISREKPEIVKKAAEVVKELGVRSKLLCGAGISSVEDIKASLELGSSGVLIASWVAKARKPEKVIEEIAWRIR